MTLDLVKKGPKKNKKEPFSPLTLTEIKCLFSKKDLISVQNHEFKKVEISRKYYFAKRAFIEKDLRLG